MDAQTSFCHGSASAPDCASICPKAVLTALSSSACAASSRAEFSRVACAVCAPPAPPACLPATAWPALMEKHAQACVHHKSTAKSDCMPQLACTLRTPPRLQGLARANLPHSHGQPRLHLRTFRGAPFGGMSGRARIVRLPTSCMTSLACLQQHH